MSLTDSLAEVMSECGDDAMELTSQFAGEQLTEHEAGQIWSHWQEAGLGTDRELVTWLDGQQRYALKIRKTFDGKYMLMRVTSIPCVTAKSDGIHTGSAEEFQIRRVMSTLTSPTPLHAVSTMMDYRFAPKCAGVRTCPQTNEQLCLFDHTTQDVTDDYDQFTDVKFHTTMRCPNVVHKEGAICGGCLARIKFKVNNARDVVIKTEF